MKPPEPYDHLKPVDIDVPDGIYRVVGRDEETVTLLRVADEDKQRVHTGEVLSVDHAEFDGFAPTENPDGNRPPRDVLTAKLEMGYWSIRAFVQQLAANPLLTIVAFTLVIMGIFGDQVLSFPDFVFGGIIFLGSLTLAYIGSGRLSF